jgi:bacteriocin-like protein
MVLHNNGFTGIDQPNTYSRRLKMIKQKQMTEQELDQVSGGPHYSDFNGRTGVIEKRNNLQEACANGTFFRSKVGRKGNEPFRGCIPIDVCS